MTLPVHPHQRPLRTRPSVRQRRRRACLGETLKSAAPRAATGCSVARSTTGTGSPRTSRRPGSNRTARRVPARIDQVTGRRVSAWLPPWNHVLSARLEVEDRHLRVLDASIRRPADREEHRLTVRKYRGPVSAPFRGSGFVTWARRLRPARSSARSGRSSRRRSCRPGPSLRRAAGRGAADGDRRPASSAFSVRRPSEKADPVGPSGEMKGPAARGLGAGRPRVDRARDHDLLRPPP